ncbi:MAG: CCA tRNA nucleotidyltransferase [Ruminococcus sp.]|nr:CCA tRNA nucleotidyltransferase [Ruminococcus sp.]
MNKVPGGEEILAALEQAGFRAYYVGGCVRDSIMGRAIHDTDITTDALPEQTMAVFSGHTVIPTGLKHGTVTVLSGGIPYEITTFRIDGSYTDSRRPDSVDFTRNIEDDLARRDFTMNAIAMDSRGNTVDPFGGRADIADGIIRCVGDPEQRFTEDALRILRAARFASQLGFAIETDTAAAMHSLSGRLDNISRERVREEFDKLLCGRFSTKVLLEYRDIIARIVPEIVPCFGFEQHSHYHKYDVYSHIVHTIEAVPEDDLLLRRAMFFHDIGKPRMFTLDENGEGHFKGHAPLSAEMAESIMKRLCYDKHTIWRTCRLISLHSEKIRDEIKLRKLLSVLGEEDFCKLMEFKKADNCGKNDFVLAENIQFDSYIEKARSLVREGFCLSLSQLAVSGNDMLTCGITGKRVGEVLGILLNKVIEGELPNDRQALTEYAGRLVK